MVDEPVPVVLPELTVIQGSLLVAVHPQSAAVVIATLPGPPADPIDCRVDASEYEQPPAIDSTAPVPSNDSAVSVTAGAVPLNVTLWPGSRMKSVSDVDGSRSSS